MGAAHSQVQASTPTLPESHGRTPTPSSSSPASLKDRCLQLLPARSFGTQHYASTPRFRFLDLPPEIRNMVYENLVVVGKVFFTPTEHDLKNSKRHQDCYRFRKPELALLRVCKQILAEAEPLYLSMNLFVLPLNWSKYRPWTTIWRGGAAEDRYVFSASGLCLVQNVSIALDQKQVPRQDWTYRDWSLFDDLIHFQELSVNQRRDIIHDEDAANLRDQWYDELWHLTYFHEGLHYLEVDLTNAYCPGGCCRPFGNVLSDTECFRKISPKVLHVLGLHPQEEREITFMDYHADPPVHYTRNMMKQCFGLCFRGPDEPTKWDMWMFPKIEGKTMCMQSQP